AVLGVPLRRDIADAAVVGHGCSDRAAWVCGMATTRPVRLASGMRTGASSRSSRCSTVPRMSTTPAPRSLFDRLVDDAAVFPPGNAPVPVAWSEHLALRAGGYG